MSNPRLGAVLAAVAVLVVWGAAPATRQPAIAVEAQQSGTGARLVAISAASPTVAWASGDSATFVRTTDGGVTWHAGHVPGATGLDFRDVHAVDAGTALLLAAGNGDRSRIYRTTDAGTSWQLVFANPDSAGFYDCIDFFDASRGLVIGDEIGGQLAILATTDGGAHWSRVPPATLPAAIAGEGSFASGGACLVAERSGSAWFGTTKGRVLRTSDFGRTWSVSTPMTTAADSVGISSLAFHDARNGFAFGGYGARTTDTLVYATSDAGATWTMRPRPPSGTGVWGAAVVPGAGTPSVVAVGPRGAAFSRDGGRTWTQIDSVNYWGVGFAAQGNRGWAVGRAGRITRLSGF